MSENYEWVRGDTEPQLAYDAFRIYLDLGAGRTHQKVCDHPEIGKSRQLITGWARQWNWTERIRAFDRHVAEAKTDGMIHQLTESRDKNLALVDKLRSHLSNRLDEFIEKKQDPTVRWTQALMAMAKLEQSSLMLKEDARSVERVERIEALVEKALGLGEMTG